MKPKTETEHTNQRFVFYFLKNRNLWVDFGFWYAKTETKLNQTDILMFYIYIVTLHILSIMSKKNKPKQQLA